MSEQPAASNYLHWARQVFAGEVELGVGVWPRAASLLLRRSIEEGLLELWREVEPGLANASGRAQLLCARAHVDPGLLGETHFVWDMLSLACHHEAYDLPPTASELNRWAMTVDRFLEAIPGRD